MSPSSASDRLIKVMRIALVGIRPSDQVMLKGYLRVLLRLEADLEWVSANHQNIDLFMVNHEFKTAENVQKLIASRPNTATLYTARNEVESGYLNGDLLVLPLKDLAPLNQWLFRQVPFLSGNVVTPSPIQSADITIHPKSSTLASSEQPSIPAPAMVANHLALTTTNPTVSPLQPQTSMSPRVATRPLPPSSTHGELLDFAQLISRLQQRENKLLAIKSPAGTLFGYIQPKQQRIWVMSEFMSLEQRWVVSEAIASPVLSTEVATDLVQWLWAQAMNYQAKFGALLDDQTLYYIDSWVKPLHNAEQHDHLKIQCVLEARSANLAEIVTLTQCSTAQVKKTIIGLLIAGVMPSAVYQHLLETLTETLTETLKAHQLTQPLVTANSQPTTINSTEAQINAQTNPIPTAHPAVSSANHTTVTNIANITPAINDANANVNTNDNGMKGFLSKLRRRLGL